MITMFDIRVILLKSKLLCLLQPLKGKVHMNAICTFTSNVGTKNLSRSTESTQNALENNGVDLNCSSTLQNFLLFFLFFQCFCFAEDNVLALSSKLLVLLLLSPRSCLLH